MAIASSMVSRMSRPAAYPPACAPVFPAAEDNGDIGANALEVFLLIDSSKSDAEPDEQDNGSDAPDDAKHGEKAAELGLPEC